MEQTTSNGDHYQQTIKSEITISGAGIHTGQAVTMRLKPAEPNTGVLFQRVDLENQPIIKADVDNVIETNRSTTLGANGGRVSTPAGFSGRYAGRQCADRNRRRRSTYPRWQRRTVC
jgi:UDP-3-O-[3-hydroxymyristoyl] N-acetylglucosamine deacetylase / 3-hydroxyacyl-[acyl-carrier-protein] dehydratase